MTRSPVLNGYDLFHPWSKIKLQLITQKALDNTYFYIVYLNCILITIYHYLGSKFSSFCNNCVKIAQGKENAFKLSLLRAHFQSLLIKIIKSFVEISLHPSRWFIRNFNGRFEDTLRNDMSFRSGSGFGTQKQSKIKQLSGKCVSDFINFSLDLRRIISWYTCILDLSSQCSFRWPSPTEVTMSLQDEYSEG